MRNWELVFPSWHHGTENEMAWGCHRGYYKFHSRKKIVNYYFTKNDWKSRLVQVSLSKGHFGESFSESSSTSHKRVAFTEHHHFRVVANPVPTSIHSNTLQRCKRTRIIDNLFRAEVNYDLSWSIIPFSAIFLSPNYVCKVCFASRSTARLEWNI